MRSIIQKEAKNIYYNNNNNKRMLTPDSGEKSREERNLKKNKKL